MSPNLAMVRGGSKFLWDGQLYDTNEAALRAAQSYQDDGFQTSDWGRGREIPGLLQESR